MIVASDVRVMFHFVGAAAVFVTILNFPSLPPPLIRNKTIRTQRCGAIFFVARKPQICSFDLLLLMEVRKYILCIKRWTRRSLLLHKDIL